MQQTRSEKPTLSRHAALAASITIAAALSACGGGGDSGPAATTPTPPPNTGLSAEQKTQLLQQAIALVDIADNGILPFDVIVPSTSRSPAVASLCPNGGTYSLRSAGTLVSPDSEVNFAQSPLAISYSQCREDDATLNGTISLSLQSTNWSSTFSDFQESNVDGSSITVNGRIAYNISVNTSANVETVTTNPTPGADITIRDNTAGLSASFVSGNLQLVIRVDDTTGQTLSKTVSAASLTMRQGGQNYLINGSLTSDEVTPGNSSGAIEVTAASGTRVGRARVTPAGLVFEPTN